MSVIKKLAGQTAIYGVSSILGRMLNLLLTPFYTKIFSEEAYGQISDVYSWTSMLNVLITFGMETAFFRYIQEENNRGLNRETIYNHGFTIVAVLSLLTGAIAIGFAQPLTHLLGYEDIPMALWLVGGILMLDNLAALPMARLRYEEKAGRFAFINMTNIILTLGLNIYFIRIQGKGIEYVFVSNLIASGVRLIMSLYETLPTGLGTDKKLLKELGVYGGFIMIAGLAGMQNENLDKILLKRIWHDGALFMGVPRSGKELLGIYAAGYKLGIFISLVTQAFRYAAEPFFFKKGQDKDAPEQFAKIFHYFTLATLIGFLVISAFMYEIVSVKILGYTFIDKKFWEGLEIVPIILMAYVISATYTQISVWFKLTNKTHFAIYYTGVGALMTLMINVLTIPRWGYYGSAWATLIAYLTMTIMVYWSGQKYFPVPYNIKTTLTYALICIIGYFICAYIGHGTGLAFMLKTFVVTGIIAGFYLWEKRRKPVFTSNQ